MHALLLIWSAVHFILNTASLPPLNFDLQSEGEDGIDSDAGVESIGGSDDGDDDDQDGEGEGAGTAERRRRQQGGATPRQARRASPGEGRGDDDDDEVSSSEDEGGEGDEVRDRPTLRFMWG